MMSISESNHEDETEEDSDENLNQDIPDEFIELYKDEELRKTLVRSLADILAKYKRRIFSVCLLKVESSYIQCNCIKIVFFVNIQNRPIL